MSDNGILIGKLMTSIYDQIETANYQLKLDAESQANRSIEKQSLVRVNPVDLQPKAKAVHQE